MRVHLHAVQNIQNYGNRGQNGGCLLEKSSYYLKDGIKEACCRVWNIPYFDLDRVCTGTYTCKNPSICILNLYTLLNITFTSKNKKIMLRLGIEEWDMLQILMMQKIEMTGLAVTVMRLLWQDDWS